MPLTKKDAPDADKADEAVKDVLDEGAGAPAGYEEAAEALPEKDEVQKEIKASLLADTSQEEAQHKAAVVDASPNAAETPSGHALKETAGIADPVERGNEYARVKSSVRWGYVVPALLADKDK